VRTASIIKAIMEVVRASETSVNFYDATWRHIPEGYQLYTHRRENLNLVDCSFLTYDAVRFIHGYRHFKKIVISSQMLVTTYKTTWHHSSAGRI
jgi:predicted acetyltransferase